MTRGLEFQQPRIVASSRATKDAARRTVAFIVADSKAEANTAAAAWKKARIAGELVQIRRFTRRVRAAGAAVELHIVVVSLRPPRSRPVAL